MRLAPRPTCVYAISPESLHVQASSGDRLYRDCFWGDDGRVNEVIEGAFRPEAPKRIHRSVEEKRRIVEATFVPETSIARTAREHGVNSNQVFQWRYEYRKRTLGGRSKSAAKLSPVVVAEPEVASSRPQVSTLSGHLRSHSIRCLSRLYGLQTTLTICPSFDRN